MKIENFFATKSACTKIVVSDKLYALQTPSYIKFLGRVLPCAVFAMLIVYCLRNVDFLSGTHGLPEIISITVTIVLHFVKRQMLLSIAGGTLTYMLLIRF